MGGHSWQFIIGVIFLLTNQFVGWGGLLLCAMAAKKTGKKVFIAYGTGIYVVSWIMVIMGLILVGPEGIRLTRFWFQSYGPETFIVLFIVITGVVLYGIFGKPGKRTAPQP